MSNLEDYTKHEELINSYPSEDIKTVYMPIDTYLQEVEDLAVWAVDDIEVLKTMNYEDSRITHIQELAGACRHAQSLWHKELNSRSKARIDWKVEGAEGFDLRNELIRSFRFAFRRHPELLKLVNAIDTGYSNADMIQDLSDLAAIGKENIVLLNTIVEQQQIDKAENMSDRLAVILAKANGDKKSPDSTKIFRDQAYSLLKVEVDELREYGKYLFWKNKDRLKGYVSAYWANKSKKKNDETKI